MFAEPASGIWAHPPWTGLSSGELGLLQRHAVTKSYARPEAVYRQGAAPRGLYCVLSGDVLLERIGADGVCTAFRIATAGDLFGYRALFSRQLHAVTARVLTNSRITLVPAGPLRRLLASNGEFGLELLKVVAADPGPMQAPLLRSPLIPAARRLAHLLLLLKDRHARTTGGGATLDLPVNKGSIAALIGIRPETVSRLFQQLDGAGICTLRRSRITIPDVTRLAAFAADGQGGT